MIKQCKRCNVEKEEDLYDNQKYQRKDGTIKHYKAGVCKECRMKRYNELYYDTGLWGQKYNSKNDKSKSKAGIKSEWRDAIITVGDRKIYTNKLTEDDMHFLYCKGYGFVLKNYSK